MIYENHVQHQSLSATFGLLITFSYILDVITFPLTNIFIGTLEELQPGSFQTYFELMTKEEKRPLRYTNCINCFYINLIIEFFLPIASKYNMFDYINSYI